MTQDDNHKNVPGESSGGCSFKQRATVSFDGFMRSSLAFRASWKGIEPPMALGDKERKKNRERLAK